MARRTPNQKALRVVSFLLGLRYKTVADAMQTTGFTEADQAEGWRLVSLLGDMRCGVGTDLVRTDDSADRLRAWSNRWMPVLRATLRRHHAGIAR